MIEKASLRKKCPYNQDNILKCENCVEWCWFRYCSGSKLPSIKSKSVQSRRASSRNFLDQLNLLPRSKILVPSLQQAERTIQNVTSWFLTY